MGDIVFILLIVAFFSLAALFVRLCDVIIGDEAETTDARGDAPELERAA